ncbi:hypothetical protein KDK95_30990, partial [Actinospica sp. MGRD01-02]
MTSLLNPPRPYTIAQLTDAQYDRLYLDWHDKVTAEVCDAIALATGTRDRQERAFAALAEDITAIPVTAPQQIPHDTPAGRALAAQAMLRNAEIFYAQRRLWHAVSDLQLAARGAREVLTELG